MTIPTRSGMTITIMPKIMHKMARIGLEMVMPIVFNPFSTTSVKSRSPFYIRLQLHRQPLIIKVFDNHAGNDNF